MHLNMVSGRRSRFTPIPATPEMDATSEEDPDWILAFLRSFPSIIRDKSAAYQAIWKKSGFGTKGSLKGLREEDLTNMKLLLSDVREIMAQLELLFVEFLLNFAPVALPTLRGSCGSGDWTHTPLLEHKKHERHGVERPK